MDFLGINVDIKNKPQTEPGFIPAYRFITGYLADAKEPYAFACQRSGRNIVKFSTFIYGTAAKRQLDLFYLKFVVQFALYSWGGYKLYLAGNKEVSKQLRELCQHDPEFANAQSFMEWVYDKPLVYELVDYESCPQQNDARPIGRHLEGCRIGFDGGASDRKVSAVIDGKVVYEEEVLWYVKFREDISYHYNEILTAFKTAAAKMPRVDAIGVSIAGLVTDDKLRGASIFKQVPEKIVKAQGQDIFQRAATEIGDDIPFMMVNDGNVAALAGSMSFNKNKLWGVAIGTSIGTGYVDGQGNLWDTTSEFSVAKIALNADAKLSEQGDRQGVGESYFSQYSIIASATAAGLEFAEDLYPAQKLLVIQRHLLDGDPRVRQIYEDIGCCFAHSIPLIGLFFDIENICLLGRVVSGLGGDIIVAKCRQVLSEEYPKVAEKTAIWLPDEKQSRVGQSVAAASLPEIPGKNQSK